MKATKWHLGWRPLAVPAIVTDDVNIGSTAGASFSVAPATGAPTRCDLPAEVPFRFSPTLCSVTLDAIAVATVVAVAALGMRTNLTGASASVPRAARPGQSRNVADDLNAPARRLLARMCG